MAEKRPAPRLIPVLDVLGGRAVHAVGGRRDEYQPINCPSSCSSRPRDIAEFLCSRAGTGELYVADLDAIRKGRVAPAVRHFLEDRAAPTWVDAGVGPYLAVRDLPAVAHLYPVVGFETCSDPAVLRAAVAEAGERPLAFSLDLKDGGLFGNRWAWGLADDRDAVGLARRAVGLGVRTLIVLDLARVGTGSGAGTEDVLRAIRAEFPGVELIAGGGVRTWADVDRLGDAGADAVLVASALYQATIKVPRPG